MYREREREKERAKEREICVCMYICKSCLYGIKQAQIQDSYHTYLMISAICCSVLQCVAVCCRALQCVAVCYSVLQCHTVSCIFNVDIPE